jgi:glucan phosphoethanolaminetransferase (alkaline phosphatase superfamily)
MDIRLQLIMVGLLALLGLPMLRFRMQRKPLYFVTASFFVMAALLFAKSCVGTSIYVDRYLMPLNIGIAFMICELMTQIDEAKTTPNLLRRFLPLGVAAALLLSLLQQRAPWYPQSDYTQRLLASIPAGVPVVSCDPGVFVI